MFNANCRLGAEGKNSLLSNSCSPVTPIWLYSMYLVYTNCIYTHMSHIPYLELCCNSWYGYKLPVNDNFLHVQAFFTGWQLLSQYLVWPQRQSVAIVSNSILILNCFQGSWLRNCLPVSVVAIENEDYSFQREINREILTRIKLMCWKCLNT